MIDALVTKATLMDIQSFKHSKSIVNNELRGSKSEGCAYLNLVGLSFIKSFRSFALSLFIVDLDGEQNKKKQMCVSHYFEIYKNSDYKV